MTITNEGTNQAAMPGSVRPQESPPPGERARQVASQSTHEAGELARDAWDQVRGILDRAQGEAREQAGVQAQRAAIGMRARSDELRALSEGRPQDAGRTGEIVQTLTARLATWAERLEQDGPAPVLDDVSRFARRRPGMFLAACAGLGFLAGRVVKASGGVNR